MPDGFAASFATLGIVGPGRAGRALGLLLLAARSQLRITYMGRAPRPPAGPPFVGDQAVRVSYLQGTAKLPRDLDGVLIAVPDRAIAEVASQLAASLARGAHPPDTGSQRVLPPVLHLSGALSLEVLAPLAALGLSVGSLHPLVALSDAETGTDRLRGAWFGVEGEGAARRLAEQIVALAGGIPLSLLADGKPLYHAAAVFASNYAVALLAVAERVLARAGVDGELGRPALIHLAHGTLASVEQLGPAAALTGPVARGDAATVQLHLARLSGAERDLYCLLAREALVLARDAGLPPAEAAAVDALLADSSSAP